MSALSSFDDDPALPAAVERLLLRAAGEIHLLGALSPTNALAERARLVHAVEHDLPARPRWEYPRVRHEALLRALEGALALVRARASLLSEVVAERLRELSLEARLSAAAGTGEVAALSAARYPPSAPAVVEEASALATAWLAQPVDAGGEQPRLLASDDPDPRSLLSMLRAEVRRRRLPFSVAVQPALAPLAATGHRVILVAPGRRVSEDDVARTVVHEIEGHAMPRARASRQRLVLFRVGTARGVDHQEGLALLFEDRAGLLGRRRRRQLAARHEAVGAMRAGATFAEVARALVRDRGLDPTDAVLAAERAFRGGDGERPGLGRERVYLESFVRVRERLAARPCDERVLAAGQVGLESIEALEAFVQAW